MCLAPKLVRIAQHFSLRKCTILRSYFIYSINLINSIISIISPGSFRSSWKNIHLSTTINVKTTNLRKLFKKKFLIKIIIKIHFKIGKISYK